MIDKEIKKFISNVEIENVFIFILLLAALVIVVKLIRIFSRIITALLRNACLRQEAA